ncbi:MAG: PEP-CTERM sorting domain-containing protein [Bryobacteraceae bacterium]|nr:PEP-CTERM sorting domain-containing protein [Bryobacteraceae bacterium]
MKKSTLTVLLLALVCQSASAAIIYELANTSAVTGGFEYTYNARLQGDQLIDTSVGRNFAVVYDFNGYIPGSASAINFVAGLSGTIFVENITSPNPIFQAPPDSAALSNIRVELNGTANFPTATTIYQLVLRSTLGPGGPQVPQSGQALKDAPGDPTDRTLTGNSVFVEGPAVNPIPEPATFAFMGTGLIGLGLLARRRRS